MAGVAQPPPPPPPVVSRSAARPRLPQGSVWAQTEAPRAQAVALEGAAAAARAAGASEDTVAALVREAEGAQQRAADGRQLGARLDSQRATVRRVTEKVAQAEEAVAAATARLAAARQELGAARTALTQIEHEVAQACPQEGGGREAPESSAILIHEVRALLDALEQTPVPGQVGKGPQLPEAVLQTMCSLRNKLQPPVPPAKLGEALEADAEEPPNTEQGEPAEPSEAASADDLMGELEDLADTDDEGLLDVARRLKRARRKGPY